MEELLGKYVRYLEVERDLSPFTVRNYVTDISHFLNFLKLEEIGSLQNVDHAVVRNYLGQLLDSGMVRTSISRKMSALRSFFRYLNREGFIDNEPLNRVSAPKMEKRLPSFLTSEEVLALLNAADSSSPQGIRDRAVMELLYAAGLRVSEITSLDIGDVELETGQITILGKGSKERMVLMGQPAIEAIRQYLEYGRPKLAGTGDDRALFLNRYGRRIAERRIQYLIKKYARQAGISGKVHPHKVRHTFATHMLDGGADLRVVQELLGHTNLSSTQIYTHVTRSQMRRRYLEAHPRGSESQHTVRSSDVQRLPE